MRRFGWSCALGTAAALVALAGGVMFASPAAADVSPSGCTNNLLNVQLAKDKNLARPGDVIMYTVSVGNEGPGACDVTNATVTATMPALNGSPTGQSVVLATGVNFLAQAPLMIIGTVPYIVAVNPGVSSVTAMSTVNGALHDTGGGVDAVNVSKTVTSQITNPHTTLVKSASPTSGRAPLNVTYTYLETNDGTNAPLSGVTVSDSRCTPVVLRSGDTNANQVLEVGETWRFTCAQRLTTAGTVANTATANGIDVLDTRPAPVETAEASVTVTGTTGTSTTLATGVRPSIGVTKSASPESRPLPGGDFTFTVKVTNTSTNDPVRIMSLVDNIYGDLVTRSGSTCGALVGTTLQPSASSAPCTFTAPFTGTGTALISQTDTVTVTGVDASNQAATAVAPATVSLIPAGVSSLALTGESSLLRTAPAALLVGAGLLLLALRRRRAGRRMT